MADSEADVPVIPGDNFFDEPLRTEPTEQVLEAGSTIRAACRQFLARRELGEHLYARLEADFDGKPRAAARRVVRLFPPERVPALVNMQRRARSRRGGTHGRPHGGSAAGAAGRGDPEAVLNEALEAAGLYFALDDEPNERTVGRAFVTQLDKPFSAETAALLSLDDLHELTAVLSRNIASLRSDLGREQQLRADLTEQCERRERVIEQILVRAGKYYSARKQMHSHKRSARSSH
jgi:hypothetical protein